MIFPKISRDFRLPNDMQTIKFQKKKLKITDELDGVQLYTEDQKLEEIIWKIIQNLNYLMKFCRTEKKLEAQWRV